jgi:hypothetical protein
MSTTKAFLSEAWLLLVHASLLLSPFVSLILLATNRSIDLSDVSRNQNALFMLALWLPFLPRAYRDNPTTSTYGAMASTLMLLTITLECIWLTDPCFWCTNAENHYANSRLIVLIWLVPLAVNLLYDRIWASSDAFIRERQNSSHVQAKERKKGSRGKVATCCGILALWTVSDVILLYTKPFSDYNGYLLTYAYYTVAIGVLGIVIAALLPQTQTRSSESPFGDAGIVLPFYLGTRLVSMTFLGFPSEHIWISTAFALGTLCFGILQGDGEFGFLGNKLVTLLVRSPKVILTAYFTSPSWLMLTYLIGTGYILFTVAANKPWFTTTVIPDASLTHWLCAFKDLFDSVVPTVFTYTETLAGAFIALDLVDFKDKIRGTLRGFRTNVYPHLQPACDGFVNTITPQDNTFVVLSLAAPVYVSAMLAFRFLSNVNHIVETTRFWRTAMLLSVLHTSLCQLFADANVSIWRALMFSFSTLHRPYTNTGITVLVIQSLMVVLSCVLLGHYLYREQATDNTNQYESSNGIETERRWFQKVAIASTFKEAVKTMLTPAFAFAVVGIILLGSALASGTPFDTFTFEHSAAYRNAHPSFTQLTAADAPIAGGMTFLSKKARIVVGMLTVALSLGGSVPDPCINIGVTNVCLSTITSLVSLATDIITSVVEKALEASHVLSILPGVDGFLTNIEKLTGQFPGVNINSLANFNILQAAQFNLTISNVLPNAPAIEVPFSFPTVNLPFQFTDLIGVQQIWIALIVIAVLFVIATFAGAYFPPLVCVEEALTTTTVVLLIQLLMLCWNAQTVLETYGYRVTYTFNGVAAVYALALLSFFCAWAINTQTRSTPDANPRSIQGQPIRLEAARRRLHEYERLITKP